MILNKDSYDLKLLIMIMGIYVPGHSTDRKDSTLTFNTIFNKISVIQLYWCMIKLRVATFISATGVMYNKRHLLKTPDFFKEKKPQTIRKQKHPIFSTRFSNRFLIERWSQPNLSLSYGPLTMDKNQPHNLQC